MKKVFYVRFVVYNKYLSGRDIQKQKRFQEQHHSPNCIKPVGVTLHVVSLEDGN